MNEDEQVFGSRPVREMLQVGGLGVFPPRKDGSTDDEAGNAKSRAQ